MSREGLSLAMQQEAQKSSEGKLAKQDRGLMEKIGDKAKDYKFAALLALGSLFAEAYINPHEAHAEKAVAATVEKMPIEQVSPETMRQRLEQIKQELAKPINHPSSDYSLIATNGHHPDKNKTSLATLSGKSIFALSDTKIYHFNESHSSASAKGPITSEQGIASESDLYAPPRDLNLKPTEARFTSKGVGKTADAAILDAVAQASNFYQTHVSDETTVYSSTASKTSDDKKPDISNDHSILTFTQTHAEHFLNIGEIRVTQSKDGFFEASTDTTLLLPSEN